MNTDNKIIVGGVSINEESEWGFARYAYSCMGTILVIAGIAAFRFMKS